MRVIQAMPRVDERIFPYNHRSISRGLRGRARFSKSRICTFMICAMRA